MRRNTSLSLKLRKYKWKLWQAGYNMLSRLHNYSMQQIILGQNAWVNTKASTAASGLLKGLKKFKKATCIFQSHLANLS